MTDRSDEIEIELALRKAVGSGSLVKMTRGGPRVKTDDELRVEIGAEMDERQRHAARRRVRDEAITRPRLAAAGPVMAVQKKAAHAAAILAALRDADYDPQSLPATERNSSLSRWSLVMMALERPWGTPFWRAMASSMVR